MDPKSIYLTSIITLWVTIGKKSLPNCYFLKLKFRGLQIKPNSEVAYCYRVLSIKVFLLHKYDMCLSVLEGEPKCRFNSKFKFPATLKLWDILYRH